MNIVLAASALGTAAALMAPTGFDERPVHPAKAQPMSDGPHAGIALSSPPPRLLKDVLLTTGYAKGRFAPTDAFWDKGGAVKYKLYDPVADTDVYQWHSGHGAAGEGFS